MLDNNNWHLTCENYNYYYNRFSILCPGLHGWVGIRRVNHSGLCWSRDDVDGSSISRTMCKLFAFCSRQITTPAPHHSNFYGPDALPDTQPTASKQWRHIQPIWEGFTLPAIPARCMPWLRVCPSDCQYVTRMGVIWMITTKFSITETIPHNTRWL